MSGFEYAFVSEVPSEYLCPICECPMREPVQTKCGHRFCKHCLEQSMKRKRKCPIDRGALDERSAKDIYPDVAIERTILNFLVKCPNERNGCEWTGELRSIEAHETNCSFMGVKCTNKDCKAAPLKKDLHNHVTNECPKRKVECHHCGTTFVWCIRQGHFDECKKYPMVCLQKCGRDKIPRDKMNDHIEKSCPHTEVKCTFAHIGCKVKVQRRAIPDHLKREAESHLKLACERLQELQDSSILATANIQIVQAEMVTAMEKIKELSEAVLERKGLQSLRDKIAVMNKKLEELQSREDATDRLSALQSEVISIKEEVKNLSRNLSNDGKLLEFQDAINELQKSIPKINSLQGLQGEVAGINKKQRNLQKAITSLEKRNTDANISICNDRRLLDEIEHVEFELRREFQPQLRYLRENAEREKKELANQFRAYRETLRIKIATSFFFLTIFILCFRYATLTEMGILIDFILSMF